MQLTGIGEENLRIFRMLMSGLSLEDHDLALGAIEDNEAAGVALFNKLGDALMLDYIYVARPFRRRGIGKALVEEALSGSAGIKSVAVHVNYPEQAQDLHLFFKALGFVLFRDGISWTVPMSTILASDAFQKLISSDFKAEVKPISGLSLKELNMLKKEMEASDFDPDILDDRRVSEELCFAARDKKTGRPVACLITEQEGNDTVILFIINFSRDASRLVDLFRKFKEAAEREGITGNMLHFVTMDERMEALARSLTGKDGELSVQGKVISAILMPSKDETDGGGEGSIREEEHEDISKDRFTGTTAAAENSEDTAARFTLRTLSKSQRTKRGIRFDKKARLQAAILPMMMRYYDKWASFGKAVPELPAVEGFGLDPARKRKLALFSTCSVSGYEEMNYLLQDIEMYNRYHPDAKISGKDEAERAIAVLRHMEETDVRRFDYKTDEDFINGDEGMTFEERFSELRLFSHSKKLLEEYGHDGSLAKKEKELVLLAGLMKEILKDYEYRAILMQSPFYTLLAEKDFDSLPDSDLLTRIKQTEHEGARNYLKLMLQRRKEQRFTRGKSAAELLGEEK